jgi:hypothetical protein
MRFGSGSCRWQPALFDTTSGVKEWHGSGRFKVILHGKNFVAIKS